MARKLQLLQYQLEESENAHRKTKYRFLFYSYNYSICLLRSSIVKYPSNLRDAHNQIQNIRKEYLLLKDFYSKDIQNWKIHLQTIKNTLQKGNRSRLSSFFCNYLLHRNTNNNG
jgi:DNA invertase Pin-like site-specific DNA recombinase